jgi:hypothetical protein
MSDPKFPNPLHESQPDRTSAAAESVVSPLPTPSVDADITDELNDHLSLAARDFQLAGNPADEAHQLARQKFGNVTAIRRRLWWIHQGDEIMLRAALSLIVVVLILAVAALGIGNWRMNEKLDELGDTLLAMSRTNPSLSSAGEQTLTIPQITGNCFIGDPSQPAKEVEVKVYAHPKRELVRRVLTDNKGAFTSGALPPGTYTVIAPLLGEANPTDDYSYSSSSTRILEPVYRVQSGLLDVHTGRGPVRIDLDLKMIPVGNITFELEGSFPQEFEQETDNYNYAVNVKMGLFVANDVPSLPLENPIMGVSAKTQTVGPFYRSPSKEHWFDARDITDAWTFTPRTPLPARTYKVGAYVRAEARPNGARYSYDFDWALKQLAALDALIDVEVKAGQRTKVRITAPDPTEEYRQAIVKYEQLTRSRRENSDNQVVSRHIDEVEDQLYRTRPVKLEVVGYYPLESEEKAKP